MTGTVAAPRWDLAPIFHDLGDRGFTNAVEGLFAQVDRLCALYEEHDIRTCEPRPASPADVTALEAVLALTNELSQDLQRIVAYLYARTTTDSRDDAAAARLTEVQTRTAPLGPLSKRLGAWLAALGLDDVVARSNAAGEHEFALQRAVDGAEWQMSEPEESLAAELASSGSLAWQRMHGDVSSQLMADVDGDRFPMAVVRGFAMHPDSGRRRAAYEGELAAWATVAVPLAAALNGAKGEAGVLNRRRGYADDLEPALRANNVDRQTLDALQDAVTASLPDFRRYFRAKARILGHDSGLPWWDLFAPVGRRAEVTWSDAMRDVLDAFNGYSPDLARLATRAFDEQWVDAEMRDGKRGGAYCVGVEADVSRVMMNFDGSHESISTLAHELGHAFHNVTLGERTPLQRRLPMALAETASIFCETLMFEHAAAHATEDIERLALLDTYLVNASQVCVDIRSRFLFETALCERRRTTSMSVTELSTAMLEAQEAAYGSGLDPDHRHEFMWAVKPHYFTPFYNWPYTFGLLFGIGLYAQYVEDPDKFRGGYDSMLSTVGMADAKTLAGRFGFDITKETFWAESLAVIRSHIDDYERLATGT